MQFEIGLQKVKEQKHKSMAILTYQFGIYLVACSNSCTKYEVQCTKQVKKQEPRNLPGGRQALINLSILKATNRESACSIAGDHGGIAAIEVEAASTRAANCTAPIEAVGTDKEERTNAAAAVARHGQFKR